MVTRKRERFVTANMPPKKTKGRKLTKNQRLKAQQEEERRLREEEEAWLQVEREIKQSEVDRLELKALECREEELDEVRHLLEENQIAVTKWRSDAVVKDKWERYLCCDGEPDPENQQEINTFITLWRDDTDLNITEMLRQCHVTVRLVEKLEDLLKEATSPQKIQIYKEGLRNLQELIYFKHNLTSEKILQRANKNIDIRTGNSQTVIKDEKVTLCLWANLSKNPSFKVFKIEGVGLGFELPKQLAESSIAVRILHTRYDHLSMLSRMTHPKTHTATRRSSVRGGKVLEDSSAQQVEEGDDTQNQKAKDEVRSIQSAPRNKSKPRSANSSGGRSSQIFTQVEAVEAEDLIVPQLITSDAIQVVDLMEYTPLGGVFYYEVFHLPPQAHKSEHCEIQQILDTGLEVFPYPTEKSSFKDEEDPKRPPVGVSVTLPDRVVFFEPPHVAYWEAACEQWRMDRISDVSYEEAEVKLSFKMETFRPFVLMQKTYINLPFQSWELRPLEQNSALFSVNGAFFNLSITIQDNQCKLQLEQERGLSHIVGQWMSRPVLQRAMLSAGINIFVDEFTDNYVNISVKDPLAERAAYEQMALVASACAFSWSKWNAECGAEHVVLQACEHHDPGPVPEGSWSLYLLKAERSKKLEITETSEAFSSEHHPNSEFHSTFIHMLQDNMSPDGLAMTRKSHYLFVDTVQSLLDATRPLVYS